MRGHGAKSDYARDQAVLALLAHPTIPEAAAACGVGEATLWRWLQEPAFAERYRAARRQVVEGAIASLQQTASEAAATLKRNLRCGTPSVEVRAALAVLEQAIKGAELLDLQERIAALEAHQEQQAATHARGRGAG